MGSLAVEIRTLASRIRTWRSLLLHLMLLAAFGIWIPQLKGLDFLDSQILGAYACLGLLFAGPATAQAFPEGEGCSFPQAAARIFFGIFYGEIVALMLLVAGVATVYATHRGGFIPQPDWPTIARCALFGLGASAMLASMAALAGVRFSKKAAMIFLRVAFFGLLILYYYRGQYLTEVSLAASGGCMVVAGVLIAVLRKVCR